MFPLLETAVGFAAIMLVLSFLVKSLTTLVCDHFDFYCDNFQYEASRLIRNLTGRTWRSWANDPVVVARLPWVADVKWERLGDEFFNEDYIRWVVKQLQPSAALDDLSGLAKVHLGKVKFAFQQRLKNLSIVIGLGLCLFLDINALAIWQTLYHNNQLRTTFASDYATRALTLGTDPAAAANPDSGNPADVRTAEAAEEEASRRADLDQARGAFGERLSEFVSDVSFGVGRAWRPDAADRPAGRRGWALEFIGAFLTGVLVSVGAPYWHDLLASMSSLGRKGP